MPARLPARAGTPDRLAGLKSGAALPIHGADKPCRCKAAPRAPMTASHRYLQRCALCGQAARRVRREPDDASHPGLRRYCCAGSSSAAGCGWQGLLPCLQRPAQLRRRQLAWRHLRSALLPLAAVAGVGFAAAALVVKGSVLSPPPPPVRAAALGVSDDGQPLPEQHALRVHSVLAVSDAVQAATVAPDITPLGLRHSCAWGRPGRNPYRGSVEQALYSAALPPEVVQAIAQQVRAGQPVDWLDISNSGIRAERSGREFSTRNIAMSYGMTLCLGTRVNFEPGHHERAALYEASDKQGRKIAVMVPQVCGNVSVIGESTGRKRPLAVLSGGDQPDDTVRWMPAVLSWDPHLPGPQGASVRGGNTVPEPGTLACVLLGLGVAVWFSRRRP